MFMAMGISTTYLIGAFIPWDTLSYCCAIAPALGCLAMIFIPESPMWLQNKGKTDEARASALWLKNEAALDNNVIDSAETGTKNK